jgi:hypothetical protein
VIPTNKSEPKHLRIEGKGMHKNPMKNSSKMTQKSHELQEEIDATMKASIHSEVRFFTNE